MFETDSSTLERTLQLGTYQKSLFVGNLLLALTSLLFNCVVLYGALKKQALKSDITTVLLLEFQTVLDLLITLFSVVPVTIVSYSGRWILGSTLCVVNAVARRYLYLTELMVVSYISLYRLSLVLIQRNSKQVGRRCRRRKNKLYLARVILLVLVLLPLFPLLSHFLGDSKVEFVPGYLSCAVPQTSKLWGYFSLAFLVIPCGIVILSNLVILYKVLRIRMRSPRRINTGFFSGLKNAINPGTMRKAVSSRVRKINHSTYITICFICLFFVMSYTSVFVIIAEGEDKIREPTPSEPPWLGLLTIELLSISVLSNPIVYTLSNMRFRRYLMGLMRCNSRGMHGEQSQSRQNSRESSDEHAFNETISKFFSTRRNSVRTPSLSSKQNSFNSRTSIITAGPKRRHSETDVPHSHKLFSPAHGIVDRRRQITSNSRSNCSIMPNVEENEPLSCFTAQLKCSSEIISSTSRRRDHRIERQTSAPGSCADLNSVASPNRQISGRPSTDGTVTTKDNLLIRRHETENGYENGNVTPDFKDNEVPLQQLQIIPLPFLGAQTKSNTLKSDSLPFIVVDENNYEGSDVNQKKFVALGAHLQLHNMNTKLAP